MWPEGVGRWVGCQITWTRLTMITIIGFLPFWTSSISCIILYVPGLMVLWGKQGVEWGGSHGRIGDDQLCTAVSLSNLWIYKIKEVLKIEIVMFVFVSVSGWAHWIIVDDNMTSCNHPLQWLKLRTVKWELGFTFLLKQVSLNVTQNKE